MTSKLSLHHITLYFSVCSHRINTMLVTIYKNTHSLTLCTINSEGGIHYVFMVTCTEPHTFTNYSYTELDSCLTLCLIRTSDIFVVHTFRYEELFRPCGGRWALNRSALATLFCLWYCVFLCVCVFTESHKLNTAVKLRLLAPHSVFGT